jgi:hypothetical protein
MSERRISDVANEFPMLPKDELAELADDIRTNGLRTPILLHPDGSVLDGRNRMLACELAGVEPQFNVWDGVGTPEDLVAGLNIHRRHLDKSQRALIKAKLLLRMELRRRENNDCSPGRTLAQEAALAGVSRQQLVDANFVVRNASEEQQRAVLSGERSVNGVKRELRAARGLPPTGSSGMGLPAPVASPQAAAIEPPTTHVETPRSEPGGRPGDDRGDVEAELRGVLADSGAEYWDEDGGEHPDDDGRPKVEAVGSVHMPTNADPDRLSRVMEDLRRTPPPSSMQAPPPPAPVPPPRNAEHRPEAPAPLRGAVDDGVLTGLEMADAVRSLRARLLATELLLVQLRVGVGGRADTLAAYGAQLASDGRASPASIELELDRVRRSVDAELAAAGVG